MNPSNASVVKAPQAAGDIHARGVRRLVAGALLASALLAIAACQRGETPAARTGDAVVEEIVAEEEFITAMEIHLRTLARAIDTCPIRGEDHAPFFAEEVTVAGPAAEGGPDAAIPVSGLRTARYSFTSEPVPRDRSMLGLWEPLAEDLPGAQLTDGQFGFKEGAFLDPERTRFRAILSFEAKARQTDGSASSVETVQEVHWVLAGPGEPPRRANDYQVAPADWQITRWVTTEATILSLPALLFEEVTATAIPDTADYETATTSKHVAHLHALFSGGEAMLKEEYGRHFTTDATAQHPCLAVADVDGDGWDDLFVGVRWGRNLLFRNRGDGTFEERGRELGLGLEEGLTAAALFADFDNDGDQDVFFGRTLEPSRYFINEDGYFIDRSATMVAGPLPTLVTSMAAADYNRDGLLDLYLCTYGFASKHPREAVARDFLSDYPAEQVEANFLSPAKEHPYVDLPGPPNVLLVNRGGGKFAVSRLSEQVASWRESLQATWADYDRDGDPDLYVCNDFAPDQLFRNDGGERFVEVTAEEGDELMLGFGMGASFGDFDNDNDLDLYVSNMFSKAGLRITKKAGTKDERLRWSAEGNRLFENLDGGRFAALDGSGGGGLPVAKAGWSWGGQFLDIDNNGFLDLYVPNGYFTVPERFAAEEDL